MQPFSLTKDESIAIRKHLVCNGLSFDQVVDDVNEYNAMMIDSLVNDRIEEVYVMCALHNAVLIRNEV